MTMKIVLIPTDYRTESLQYIQQLLAKFYPEEVEVIMVHMMSITDCERELLMLSRRSAEYRHISDEFYETCINLKNEYEDQLKNIRMEFFYGNTSAVFLNFTEANNVDFVLQMPGYEYRKLNKASINPEDIINRCGTKISVINALQLEKIQTTPLQSATEVNNEQETTLAEQYV